MDDIINIKNISFFYTKKHYIFKDFNLKIEKANLNLIKGSNGSGKTTLLKLILNILKPKKGKIIYNKNLIFSYVPQYLKVDDSYPMTVKDLLFMGLVNKYKIFFKQNNKLLKETLNKVGFDDNILNDIYGQFSGGQKQRLLIARAIINNFDVIILDEPFANLDIKSTEIIRNILFNLINQQKTIILVSHKEEFKKFNLINLEEK